MSATDTAKRVLDWAVAGQGRPPRGDLRLPEELAAPAPELRDRIAALCSVSCAKLGWAMPPLGDSAALSLDCALIAAAIGFAESRDAAEFLLQAIGPSASPGEWAARHRLVSRACRHVPKLAPTLRAASPLTPLFERASEAEAAFALKAAETLRRHPDGRRSLIRILSCPSDQPDIRAWRSRLLEHWRAGAQDERSLVLEVYEATLVFHEAAALRQIRDAARLLASAATRQEMRDAITVGRWWRPLALIERNEPDLLRSLRHLGAAYRQGVDFSRTAGRAEGAPL